METLHLDITFTSDCNLRCTYCAVSQPGYHGQHLSKLNIDEILKIIDRGFVSSVQLSGHGETTMLDNWVDIVSPFLSGNLYTSLISNFSRAFTDVELDTLLKLSEIMISIDTVDREVLRIVRKPVRAEMIVYNMLRLKARARLLGLECPKLVWNNVLSVESLAGLESWYFSGRELGVETFILSNLVQYPNIQCKPISTLSRDDRQSALSRINKLVLYSKSERVKFDLQRGLLALLKGDAEPYKDREGYTGESGSRIKFYENVPKGFSRDCLEPWTKLRIHSNGEVIPCCFFENDPIGQLGHDSVNTIINGDRRKAIQTGLLSPEYMHRNCKICPEKSLVPVSELVEKVKNLSSRQSENSTSIHYSSRDTDRNKIVITDIDKSTLSSSQSSELEVIKGNTMVSGPRLSALYSAVTHVLEKHIPGDFVECGVWKGGCAALMLNFIASDERKLWLFDTFEGMPAPTIEDFEVSSGIMAQQKYNRLRNESGFSDWCFSPLNDVKSTLEKIDNEFESKVMFVKGKVEDTLKLANFLPEKVSILRLDTDWYSSTKIELETLFPCLVKGGVLIVDDFSDWNGSRQACLEYFGPTFGLNEVFSQAFLVDGCLVGVRN